MKKFFMLVFCLMLAVGSYAQREHLEITKDQLPDNVIEFLDKYYSDSIYNNPKYFIEFEYEFRPNAPIDDFEVHFSNGTKVEFNKYGYLTSIDCGRGDSVNINIIPSFIKNQIKRYNKRIVDYNIDYDRRDKKPLEYEIDFENGFECTFNHKGKLIRD